MLIPQKTSWIRRKGEELEWGLELFQRPGGRNNGGNRVFLVDFTIRTR